MKKRQLSIIALAALAAFMAGKGCREREERSEYAPPTRDTVRVVTTDTVSIVRPEVRTIRVRDTVSLTISRTALLATEAADSVEVALPREERVYADSSYRAVVSGIAVSLDSITVMPRTETITIREKLSDKRWTIGPSVGLMWDGRRLSPAIGVSLTYRFAAF